MSDVESMSLPLRDNDREITENQVVNWLVESQVFANLTATDLRPLMQSLQILNFKALDEVIAKDRWRQGGGL